MADLKEIEAYLIEHPDDDAQRWHLTKKLYMACEYRDALSHLLILKRSAEWKLNYSRYLAATYYRLGRYEESIQELKGAVASWPQEMPLREQLARAYEVASNTDEAVHVWQEILEIDPQHPIAAQSIGRLTSSPIEPSSESELLLKDSDSGIDLAAGTVCPKCGARNSLEFDRCWQCHALLAGPGTPTPMIKRPAPPSWTGRVWTVVIGFAGVALLSLGVFLTLDYAARRPAAVDGFIVASSVDALLDHEWFMARVAAGCTLLLAWPAILWLASITCCDRPIPFTRVLAVSVPAATLTYVLLWLPFRMIPLAILAPVILTLIMILLMFPVSLFRALIVWSVQIVLALLCGFGVFAALTNVATFNNLQTLVNLDAAHAAELPDGAYRFTVSQLPGNYAVSWKQTGARWVDSAGRQVLFSFARDGSDAPLTVEFMEAGQTLVYREDAATPFTFTYSIGPGRNYVLRLTGEGKEPVHVTISGLLLPEVVAQ